MTGNISYLFYFEEINGGYVAFGGNPKGGKITGIKSEFSIARTPQQNRVAERKNRTLIEAARTMLADSLLPIPFWAEAVNTPCYVQNRVLVTKPCNKTPYELLLVAARNQPNSSAGIQGNFNAGTVGKGTVFTQQYVLLPLWSTSSKDPQNTNVDASFDDKENESEVHVSLSSSNKKKKHDEKAKKEAKGKSPVELSSGVRDLNDEFEEFYVNNTNRDNAASTPVIVVEPNSTNNTNIFNAADPSNNVVSSTFEISRKSSFVDPSQYPNNPNMPALEGIIYSDDEEDVGANTDLSNLETSITVSPISTNRVHKDHPVTQIIDDLSLAPQTRSMIRMVNEQGHTQEEGMDYEEVFALVARIEAKRLFLAYASFMDFMVYHMDVKSAFLYGTIEEEVICGLPQAPRAWYETLSNYLLENGFQKGKIDQTLFIKKHKGDIFLIQVYVDDIIFRSTNKDLYKAFKKLMKDKFQMSSMGELTFFLGLQVKQKDNGIFISQDKYVAKILRKFGLTDGKSASTPIDTEKPLLKDPNGEDVDVHTYRYLKGKPHLGLWYPKDYPFTLVAYSDSDYAGASFDSKSIIGGCQFLCCRLISWQYKKQTVVATSLTEAEYVAAASCCAQVLWIQN
nr:hypothetical protein [Tanacetum cinerariifolium]